MFSKVTRVGESVEVPINELLKDITKQNVSDLRRDVEYIRLEMRAEEDRSSSSLPFTRLTNFTVRTLRMFCLVFEFVFEATQILDYKLVLSKKEVYDQTNTNLILENRIGLWCLNSSIVFNQLSNKCRSVILTSGTLSPLHTFSGVLSSF
jgi:Fanconi anemia group J protein